MSKVRPVVFGCFIEKNDKIRLLVAARNVEE